MGADRPKQYLPLGGWPVLWHVLVRLEASPLVTDIVLVVRREDMDYCRRELSESGDFTKIAALVPGGAERSESVYKGLQETRADMVLVHDAVRPFISEGLLERVVAATREHGAALPALPVVETIKEVADDQVVGTPCRERLWQAQTPQGFNRKLLLMAYHAAGTDAVATDDAALVERLGHAVCVVLGEADNRKLTTPDDLAWAEWRIRTREDPTMGLRIGQGYDVHRLEEGRPLILGGVVVPFERGLAGHSDADVLTHAIIDALLGALSAGDIGQLFPDSDAQYKDISSLVLLEQVGAPDRGTRGASPAHRRGRRGSAAQASAAHSSDAPNASCDIGPRSGSGFAQGHDDRALGIRRARGRYGSSSCGSFGALKHGRLFGFSARGPVGCRSAVGVWHLVA